MSIKELNIYTEYRPGKNDAIHDFFIPVLSEAVLYKRAVGFFSSTALVQISKGIINLVKNNGKIQLIASPRLSEEDIEAIKKGYEERDKIIETALMRGFIEPKTEVEEKRLNLLANLIANRQLDIKIAFPKNFQKIGMYHEKMGLIYDAHNNIVAFSGSTNETGTAFLHNYEVIDVFCSWKSEEESKRVYEKQTAFDKLWSNADDSICIIDFPKVAKDKLQSYNTGGIDYLLDNKECKIAHTQKQKNNSFVLPTHIELYDYQKEAISSWMDNKSIGLFDMATGTGKTLTALGAIAALSEQLNHEIAVVIVCPFQHLVEQWLDDIIKFGVQPIVAYSKYKDWRVRLKKKIGDYNRNKKNGFCVIATNATFSSNDFQKLISKTERDTCLIIDEAHNFGTPRLQECLKPLYKYRLALSATFERHHDEEGTAAILDFFGNKKCIEYTLERAILEEKLTPYYYYPVVVYLDEDELGQYREISIQMGKCIITYPNGSTGLNNVGKMLAIKRSRVVAGAKAKLFALEKIMQPYKKAKNILVYCGATRVLREDSDVSETDVSDERQIYEATRILGGKLNMDVHRFTSEEPIDKRNELKESFAKGNLQALIAIKCLDEGVNIPSIKTAFILASTTNPKEYIQRRGRVLRLYNPDPVNHPELKKEFAEIYDFITLPMSLDKVWMLTEEEVKQDSQLVKNELSRMKEFARLSRNPISSNKTISEIEEAYRVDIY